jgi:hypothetical protein
MHILSKPPIPSSFKNITIGPMSKGKYAIVFKTDRNDVEIPHFRRKGNRLIDISNIEFDATLGQGSPDIISEPTIFAGPCFQHFGHFVAECIHRIYARRYFPELKGAKIAFLVKEGESTEHNSWLECILKILGVDMEDVIFIDRPKLFSQLYIPYPGRIMSGPTLIKDYANIMPYNFSEIDGSHLQGKMIYVSRSKHLYSGGYIGESFVEKYLSSFGFETIYPESMSTDKFVGLLRSSRCAVFSEGSSIHNLELCGKTSLAAFVIGRRTGTKERFEYILEDHCSTYDFYEETRYLGSMEWDPRRDKPMTSRGLATTNIANLLKKILVFFELPFQQPDLEDLERWILADIGRYLLDSRATRSRTTSNEQLGKLLTEMRSNYKLC